MYTISLIDAYSIRSSICTKELAPSEIQCTDYTDYLLKGNLTLKNGHIDKYQFEEGYCQAEKNSSNASIDDFAFCYYDQDHLGNIRQVTKADGSQTGNVVQTINYYPFGMQFCDGTTCYFDQKHKYNGKEFDNMYGLNTYDYGARQYNPVTARWDRMDPLCEKYYNVSPYTYCINNPMKNIDLDGRMCGDYYSMNGNFLATDGIDDNKKYIIYDDDEAKNIRKTGSVESVQNAMEVPSDEQINSGQTCFDEGNKIGKETGFVMGGGTTSSILSGDDNSVNLGKGYEELQQKGIKVQSDAHYHPFDFKDKGNGNYSYSSTQPSKADKNWRMQREEKGLNDPKSPSWILGSELNGPVIQGENGKLNFHTTESIRFNTGSNTSESYSWKKFKKVVRKLNRK